MEIAVIILGGLVVFQQVYYLRQIQKLIDKLMSRSYMEYTKATSPTQQIKIEEQGVPDDLRVLQGFTI